MTWTCRLLLLACAAAPLAAHADPAPGPTASHSAACVAALKARAEPLAERVRRGDAEAEVQLMPIVTASFAFIATVYKQGLRSREAEDLLRDAEQAQAGMPPEQAARLQAGCHKEGQALLAQANFLERELVKGAARARIAKLRPST